jgi:prephenate dehydrogenase
MSEGRRTVAVFGPGLMGGSLLLALRERQPSWTLRAWGRRPAAVEQLQARNLADFCSTEEAAVAQGADVVVLCVPVDKLAAVARAAAPGISAEAVVTDVGSVKGDVVAELEGIFGAHRNFVGSHPMCGSEAAGLAAARADLYDNAICAVTPTKETRAGSVAAASSLWEAVGGRVVEMTPEDHDRAAALASHVPHVAAAALVEAVRSGPEAAQRLCATGFRDTTRVADGAVSVWEPILMQNRRAVVQGLQELTEVLQSVRRALENNDASKVAAFLESARAGRRALLERPS